ncbi:MAG: hypothetical protein KDE51_23890, partial [Anaerolineales bacterium]|nr:hypothetical protein [Anaerolineales bacterium]
FAVGLMVLQILMYFAVLFAYILLSPAGAMGRFFFPGLPALVILIFYGLAQWVGLLGRWINQRTAARGLTAVTTVLMAILAAVALFGYLAPAYAPPPTWDESDLAAVSHPVDVQFASLVKLRGYNIDRQTVTAAGMIEVELYWEVLNQPPGDYWLFVHLIDDVDALVAQRDTHPALGKFPSSQWRPGDRFVDTISLPVPATAYPSTAALQIGLYEPGAYRLPVSAADGTALGDAFVLNDITITAAEDGLLPNSSDLNFGPYVRLLSYEYNTREVNLGEDIEITLRWEMLQRDLDGQVSQVVVTSADGSWRKWSDNSLQKRRPPEGEGNIIVDVHSIGLNDGATPGTYEISILLIDFFTQNRANIVAEDGHWIDNELKLSPIRVIDPTATSASTDP